MLFNALANIVYGLISLLYYLLCDGTIRINGTISTEGIIHRFTDEYIKFLDIAGIVIAVIGVGLLVYNWLKSKYYKRVGKVASIIATCSVAFSLACYLIFAQMPITCVCTIIAGILMLPFGRK